MQRGCAATAGDATDPAEALFLEAIGRPAGERESWIAARAETAEAVRDAALRMLRALGASAERVDSGLGALRREVVRAVDAGDGSAGRYVLLQRIGSGGFGEVFVGMQEHPVRRLVAVKLLHDAIGSPAAAARFGIEQQAIASLDHPGIAPLLDAGTLADGRPWFAMPFIAGVPITHFAEERAFGARARVELLCAACDAVEHAHRRGVIHRDLKPANVLVDDATGRVRPRVIDFGVAKLADASFAGAGGQRTVQGELLGTPEYMAPEQAEGGVPDTRNDAFSMGVILYELLARRLPRAADRLRAGGRAALAGAIRSVVPPPPSGLAGACGGIDDALDAICLRAIAADPEDRYASVAALHEDLRRWLDGEDPLALRTSRWRVARRWARRHRAAVAAVAVVALALLAATVLSLRAADAARAAERRADRRAQQSARVMEYLAGIIRGADPTQQDGRPDVTVRETLGRAVADLDAGALEEAPLERAEIRRVLGDAYAGIGMTDDALREYGQALDALASADPPAPAAECAVAIQASSLLANMRRGVEAVAFAERAMSAAARSPDPGRDAARAKSALGESLRTEGNDLARAQALLEESVAALRPLAGSQEDLAAALNNLGIVRIDRGDLDGARSALEEAIRINESLGTAGGYRAMFELHNLATAERVAGKLEDAERHGRQALALVERFAGKDHPNRASVLGNLALVLRGRKEFPEGESVQREALRVLEASGAGQGADAGIAWLNIASLCRDQGKVDEAVEAGGRAVAILERAPETDPWLLAAARMAMGRALVAAKRWQEAEAPLLAAWTALEPLDIDARRRSAALLAVFQLYRDWAAADAGGVPADALESWRDRVRSFDVANPGVIPEGAY
jgi:tetratricopeptide (TPR) repeat protein